ncbi:pectinesterase family protein, partial [Genlisea aurea]
YQDTLYAHIQRQYYRNCRISGTIDFVFGDALSIFQNCTFLVRNPLPNQSCMVTAQGRFDPRSVTAIVIDGCEIRADPAFLSRNPMPRAYLGRPWKVRSRTIIMRTEIGGFIAPEGWAPWDGEFALDTLYYAEYGNTGPGSNTTGRVTWRGIQHIESEAAALWSPTRAYGGDGWITKTGIPYSSVTVMA